MSAFGVATFYFLIPKMGVGNMMAYALTGQILVAATLSHFGLFGLPEINLNMSKLMGAALMVIGLYLLNIDINKDAI